MSDAPNIEPAMTADEWRRFAIPGVGVVRYQTEDGLRHINRPHALAAIALLGQPFGFTQEGLEALRTAVERSGGDEQVYPHLRLARSELAKIAALLPAPL